MKLPYRLSVREFLSYREVRFTNLLCDKKRFTKYRIVANRKLNSQLKTK